MLKLFSMRVIYKEDEYDLAVRRKMRELKIKPEDIISINTNTRGMGIDIKVWYNSRKHSQVNPTGTSK